MSSQATTPDQEHLFQQVTHLALSEAGALLSAAGPCEIGFRLTGCRHDDRDALLAALPAEADFLCVSQTLRPPAHGSMLWLSTEEDAQRLLLHLLGDELQLEVLTEMEEEALTEIGNRIINRCLEHHAQLTPLITGAGAPQLWRDRPDKLRQILPPQPGTATLAEIRLEQPGPPGRAWLLWCGEPWQQLQQQSSRRLS